MSNSFDLVLWSYIYDFGAILGTELFYIAFTHEDKHNLEYRTTTKEVLLVDYWLYSFVDLLVWALKYEALVIDGRTFCF